MSTTRISDSDLASVALYDKVNQMVDEVDSENIKDGVTINTNLNGKVQAIGVVEKNYGGVVYNWIGTLSEYTEQNIEESHPEWVCYITDLDESPKIIYWD